MTETELLFEASLLLVVGMGIVFGFLLLLVGILRGMSSLALKIAPDEPLPAASPAPLPAAGSDGSADLIAVISAAVARYRSGR